MSSTLNVQVCPHDTATNPDRWFRFVQYCAQKMDCHPHFEIALDFADFHANLDTADVVYANPSDTLNLMAQGMTVLVRPINIHDEVVFLSNLEIAAPTLETLQGVQIASVESLQPTKLALHILKERGIVPAGIMNHESWTAVVSCLWRGECQFGLIYKDTYDGLSEQGKGMVRAFHISDERVAFHNILVGHNATDRREGIEQVLLGMHTDEKGQEVLRDLGVEQWVRPTPEELAKMRHIMESY
ncbi:MAG: phosphate/phosphite/phosphonate ABC transporter substrate-binding protein [Chloroflexaceae bacterium]|nr:phosphate/phosphite/phosphonate ABC transporter substrate-binding protein [Chloroflexaceae bacterium]